MLTTETLSPPTEAGSSAISKRVVTAVLWGCFAAVVTVFVCEYSIHLAGARIYHEEECRSVCAAHFLATGQGAASGTPVSLFLLPLTWLARGATHSVELYASARFFSAELFWLNVVLLTVAAGGKLFSRQTVVALAGAATLAPLWDFGIEIQPDNMVLTGLLLMWCVLRVRPEGLQSYFIAGLLAAGLQFVAFKSLAYSLPLSLAAVIFPPPGHKTARAKAASAWLAGAAISVLLVRIGYGAASLWNVYVQNWSSALAVADEQSVGHLRFFGRLATQCPLLLALAVAALAALIADVRKRGRRAFFWDGAMPEGLLFLLVLTVFCVSPKPFPNELLYVGAFAFLLVARYTAALWNELIVQPAAFGLVGALVLFGHLIPFVTAARTHWNLTNYHQEILMNLAEQMTVPGEDAVYDNIGMEPTRRSVDYQLLSQKRNNGGVAGSLSQLLTSHPAAVLIADGRFDRLSHAEADYVLDWYVPIAGDFWTLGKLLPTGGGEFKILHPGRYRITSAEASNLLGTYPKPENWIESLAPTPKFPPLAGALDGVPLNGNPVELAAGTHRLECAVDTRAAIVWLGPQLDSIARMSDGRRDELFVNWY